MKYFIVSMFTLTAINCLATTNEYQHLKDRFYAATEPVSIEDIAGIKIGRCFNSKEEEPATQILAGFYGADLQLEPSTKFLFGQLQKSGSITIPISQFLQYWIKNTFRANWDTKINNFEDRGWRSSITISRTWYSSVTNLTAVTKDQQGLIVQRMTSRHETNCDNASLVQGFCGVTVEVFCKF